MARITSELKALVERQLVTKIIDTVAKANAEAQIAGLAEMNEAIAARNAVRDQLKKVGLFDAIEKANKILDKQDVLGSHRNDSYRGYYPEVVCNNFSAEYEKPSNINNLTYFSVSYRNTAGNLDIHRTSLSYSGGMNLNKPEAIALKAEVDAIVNAYDKALVSVSMGGDFESAKKILAQFGVEI